MNTHDYNSCQIIDPKNLRVGDLVVYEIGFYGLPRWYINNEVGVTGIFYEATVTKVDNVRIVTYSASLSGSITWPSFKHHYYEPDQWKYPGYLRLKNQNTKTFKFNQRCECGCEAVYGVGCVHST